jgi:hypothetical protein
VGVSRIRRLHVHLSAHRPAILEQLEDGAAGQLEEGGVDLDLVVAQHLRDVALSIEPTRHGLPFEQLSVEGDRPVEVRHREADVIETFHARGAGGAKMSS